MNTAKIGLLMIVIGGSLTLFSLLNFYERFAPGLSMGVVDWGDLLLVLFTGESSMGHPVGIPLTLWASIFILCIGVIVYSFSFMTESSNFEFDGQNKNNTIDQLYPAKETAIYDKPGFCFSFSKIIGILFCFFLWPVGLLVIIVMYFKKNTQYIKPYTIATGLGMLIGLYQFINFLEDYGLLEAIR